MYGKENEQALDPFKTPLIKMYTTEDFLTTEICIFWPETTPAVLMVSISATVELKYHPKQTLLK